MTTGENMAGESVEVVVELSPGEGPIRGRVRHATGRVEAFAGWLELSTTLEHARPLTARGSPSPYASAATGRAPDG